VDGVRIGTGGLAGRGQQAHRGRDAVVAALLDNEEVSLSGVEWMVATGRWEALCSGESETAAGGRQHLTMLLEVVAGNWQLVYQHLG
jgi:hypothetical protein